MDLGSLQTPWGRGHLYPSQPTPAPQPPHVLQVEYRLCNGSNKEGVTPAAKVTKKEALKVGVGQEQTRAMEGVQAWREAGPRDGHRQGEGSSPEGGVGPGLMAGEAGGRGSSCSGIKGICPPAGQKEGHALPRSLCTHFLSPAYLMAAFGLGEREVTSSSPPRCPRVAHLCPYSWSSCCVALLSAPL